MRVANALRRKQPKYDPKLLLHCDVWVEDKEMLIKKIRITPTVLRMHMKSKYFDSFEFISFVLIKTDFKV